MLYPRLIVALLAVSAVACKGKESRGTASTTTGSAGSGATVSAGSGATGSAGSGATGSAPTTRAATLAGNAEFGCIGWSPAAKTAACVVGSRGVGERSAFDPALRLVYVGIDDSATELAVGAHDGDAQPYEEDALGPVNAALAADGYVAFIGDGIEADEGKTTELASGVALTWKKTTRASSEDEEGKLETHAFTLRCGGKAMPLVKDEQPKLDAKVTARSVPGHVVIEVVFAFGHDSDQGESGHAFVVDVATCAVRSAAP